MALIDPFKRGHHRSYTSILSEGLLKNGIEAVFIGDREIADYLTPKGVLTHCLNLKDHNNPVFRERAKFAFVKKALSFTRGNFDIVHFLYVDRLLRSLGLFLDPELDPPLCATLHWGYLIPEFSTGNQFDRVKCFSEKMALRKIIRNGSRIMVHSRILSERFSQYCGTKSFDPIPYPVETEPNKTCDNGKFRNQMHIPERCILLLCFGETRYEKGFDLAIKALAQLPENFHLAICGPPKDIQEEELFKLGQKMGVSRRLHLNLGYVRQKDMTSWFMAADIVIIPYRPPFSGQSGPLINAANMGLPLVVSDLPVLKETVDKYGLGNIFREENIDSLVKAILLTSQNLQKVRNVDFITDHSHEKFVDSVIRSYIRTIYQK